LAVDTTARRESLGADSPFLIDSDRRRPVFAPLCAKFFWGECRTVGKANRNEKSKRARCICIRVSIATDIIDACKKSRFYRYFLQSRGGLYRCAPIARAQARTQCAMSSSRALTRALRARLYTLR
jgi:hypothetical protein